MTDQTPPPTLQPGQNPRAAAKAAKAYAKATRPWFKKKRFILPIALVVIVIAATSLSGGDDGGPEKVASDGTSSDKKADKSGSKAKPIKLGETVKLEGTQYTVESAKTSATVGGEFLEEEANGIFVIVELTVENKKDETKVFSDSAANFIATNDKSYATDSEGSVAVLGDGDDSFIFMDMQPDLPETGTLVFDVPKNLAKGGLLEVSDLFGGGEAYIDLGLK